MAVTTDTSPATTHGGLAECSREERFVSQRFIELAGIDLGGQRGLEPPARGHRPGRAAPAPDGRKRWNVQVVQPCAPDVRARSDPGPGPGHRDRRQRPGSGRDRRTPGRFRAFRRAPRDPQLRWPNSAAPWPRRRADQRPGERHVPGRPGLPTSASNRVLYLHPDRQPQRCAKSTTQWPSVSSRSPPPPGLARRNWPARPQTDRRRPSSTPTCRSSSATWAK